MKTVLLLIILVAAAVGCSPPNAPVMKRVPNYEQIDEHYLKDVFLANYTGPRSVLEMSNSVSQLEEHLKEFQTFMGQVEAGTVPVKPDLKGVWDSFVMNRDGTYIQVQYTDRLGSVIAFSKSKDGRLIYGFEFSKDGHLSTADTQDEFFGFDDHGRVRAYRHR